VQHYGQKTMVWAVMSGIRVITHNDVMVSKILINYGETIKYSINSENIL